MSGSNSYVDRMRPLPHGDLESRTLELYTSPQILLTQIFMTSNLQRINPAARVFHTRTCATQNYCAGFLYRQEDHCMRHWHQHGIYVPLLDVGKGGRGSFTLYGTVPIHTVSIIHCDIYDYNHSTTDITIHRLLWDWRTNCGHPPKTERGHFVWASTANSMRS